MNLLERFVEAALELLKTNPTLLAIVAFGSVFLHHDQTQSAAIQQIPKIRETVTKAAFEQTKRGLESIEERQILTEQRAVTVLQAIESDLDSITKAQTQLAEAQVQLGKSQTELEISIPRSVHTAYEEACARSGWPNKVELGNITKFADKNLAKQINLFEDSYGPGAYHSVECGRHIIYITEISDQNKVALIRWDKLIGILEPIISTPLTGYSYELLDRIKMNDYN